MKIELSSIEDHLFILGAGSSVDYGLPTWSNLAEILKNKINSSPEGSLQYKTEIMEWIDKVGQDKEHDTIDRCITKESRSKVYRSNGLAIENSIFLLMKEIFRDIYSPNEDGWINKLNQVILDRQWLENKIAFINYNYDNVLDENILKFDFLTEKELNVDYRVRIANLDTRIPIFYPHGNFFSETELSDNSYLNRNITTNKTDLTNVIDAISCHESEAHTLKKYGSDNIKLYILGLGWGLPVNLEKITFIMSPVSEIHVTIKDSDIKEKILETLSTKFNIPVHDINVYGNCDELIEQSFK